MAFKPIMGYAAGSSPTFTDVTITGDLTVQGNFNFGDVSSDALTVNGTLHLIDDAIQSFGNTAAAPDSKLLFSTVSSNANGLRWSLPTAGVDNIPLLIFGTSGILSADLTSYAGSLNHGIGVMNNDLTGMVSLIWDESTNRGKLGSSFSDLVIEANNGTGAVKVHADSLRVLTTNTLNKKSSIRLGTQTFGSVIHFDSDEDQADLSTLSVYNDAGSKFAFFEQAGKIGLANYTTDGLGSLSSAIMSIDPATGNQRVSTELSVVDSVSTYFGVQDTITISNTVNSAQQHYGSDVTLSHVSNTDLTGLSVALIGYFLNGNAGTVSEAVGVIGEVDTLAGGTITEGSGFLAAVGQDNGGAFATFNAFKALNPYVGTVGVLNLFKAESGYVSNSRAFNVDAGGIGAGYIPISRTDTGITFDSSDLTFATTTSGDIVFTPADGSYSYGYATKTDPSGSFAGWSFDTYITLTEASAAYGNGFTATLSLEDAGFNITGPQVVVTSFYYNYDKTGTVSKAVNYRAEMWNYGFAGAGNITDAVAFQGYVDEQSGEITKYTLLEGLTSPGGQVVTYNVLSLTAAYTSNTYTIANTINNVAAYIPFSTVNTGITWDSKNFVLATTTSGDIQLTPAGVTTTGRRFEEGQGADVASANNLSLGLDGNSFEITGTTEIQLIANTSWQNGSVVTLMFTSTPTVKHATATSGANVTILLAGAADFAASAGDMLTLRLSEIGGTQAWRELSRTVI